MKQSLKKSLLIIVLVTLSLVFLYFIKIVNHKPVPQTQIISKQSFGLPIRLIIPAINVDTHIQYLDITPNGEMEVPNNIVDVGWFKLGSRPGEKGSAVIAGHFNGKNNEAGVFTNLDKLKEGDRLSIEDDLGNFFTFIVQKKELYDSGYADDVFNQNGSAHLNLVTCDGLWDEAKKSYTKRLVIFTDISTLDK